MATPRIWEKVKRSPRRRLPDALDCWTRHDRGNAVKLAKRAMRAHRVPRDDKPVPAQEYVTAAEAVVVTPAVLIGLVTWGMLFILAKLPLGEFDASAVALFGFPVLAAVVLAMKCSRHRTAVVWILALAPLLVPVSFFMAFGLEKVVGESLSVWVSGLVMLIAALIIPTVRA